MTLPLHQLLNTLYVTSPGAYLNLDHDTIRVSIGDSTPTRIPLQNIGGLVCCGDVKVTVPVLRRFAEEGRPVVLLGANGAFSARVEGRVSGNVLLRKAQYAASDDPTQCLLAARLIVAGKVQNCRALLMRGAREAPEGTTRASELRTASEELGAVLRRLRTADHLDQVRGFEGEAARIYYRAFPRLISPQQENVFTFEGRSRRPPRDRVNALLSFLYTLLAGDCASAAEAVGLDPQVGFLHTVRPGRPALALDLMEEFRPVIAERVALTLINRRQLSAADFELKPGGAVLLTTEARKCVITEYQRRKQEVVTHPLLQQRLPLGLVPHVQARLIARWLRGELDAYLPFTYR